MMGFTVLRWCPTWYHFPIYHLVSFKLCGDRAFALEVEGFFVAESGDRSLFVVDTVDGQNPALPIIRNIP